MAKKKATKKAATSKAPASSSAAKKAVPALSELDRKTLGVITTTADRVHKRIQDRVLPELKFPVRSLQNVNYTKSGGYFELGKSRKARALTVNTVKSFAQTLRLMALSKEMVENDNFATKREAYYISKNWSEAQVQPAARVGCGDGRHRGPGEPRGPHPRATALPPRRTRRRPRRQADRDRPRPPPERRSASTATMGTGAYTIPPRLNTSSSRPKPSSSWRSKPAVCSTASTTTSTGAPRTAS
ncbi:MAG: hypothetical protein R3E96_05550 [Planctomycetota bacterium]